MSSTYEWIVDLVNRIIRQPSIFYDAVDIFESYAKQPGWHNLTQVGRLAALHGSGAFGSYGLTKMSITFASECTLEGALSFAITILDPNASQILMAGTEFIRYNARRLG